MILMTGLLQVTRKLMDSSNFYGRPGQFPFSQTVDEPMEVDDYFCDIDLLDSQGACALWDQRERYSELEKTADQNPWHSNIPQHWMKMKPNTTVVATVVEPDTQEYIKVAFQFMTSMKFPDTEVVRIFRIQNPFLWKHYTVKHQEMVHENNGKEILEKHLFHGTKIANIDAICHKGFDWRVCGRHGTKYGQGCYFAQDSKYSHMYSPKSCDPRDQCHILQSAVSPQNEQERRNTDFSAAEGNNVPGRDRLTINIGRTTLRTENAVQCDSSPIFPTSYFSHYPTQPKSSTAVCDAKCSRQHSAASHFTSNQWPSGLHYMFLARVLVGNMVQGHTDYRRPPALEPGKPLTRFFDSCVNSVLDPTIFVIFDSNQAYPEYVIEYKTKVYTR